jgi:hypothetical protein
MGALVKASLEHGKLDIRTGLGGFLEWGSCTNIEL